MAEVEGSDKGSLAWADFDEAFAFESEDGFADGGAAEFEGVDVVFDGDGCSRGEEVGEDLAFQGLVGQIGGGEGRRDDGHRLF